MIKLKDYLNEKSFLPKLSVNSKEELIRQFLKTFTPDIIEENDVEELAKLMIEREKLSSTGIGNHVAIPHIKNQKVKDIAWGMVILDNEIDFDSVDNKPVKYIFMVVAPAAKKGGAYLELLAKLSRLLHNEEFLEVLTSNEINKEKVLSIIEELDIQ